MSVGSPSAFLLWAVLACIFLAFHISHIWAYDRFRCLRWNAGKQPATFKRIMTYSYLTTVPLLVVFNIWMTVLKFREGYIQIDGHIIPRPTPLWAKSSQSQMLALCFALSVSWGLEITTHLEELLFWVFMLHQAKQRQWFTSWEFRAWYLGSMVAMIGVPLTALITRRQLDLCFAWIILVGSFAGAATTLLFIYVLVQFPAFIRHVKLGGADPGVVVRLATFNELNISRVIFRMVFHLPLMVLALDAVVKGPHKIVTSVFWSDLLLMLGAIGCFASSALTLHIFFPRSVAQEYESHQVTEGEPDHSVVDDTHPNLDIVHDTRGEEEVDYEQPQFPDYYHHRRRRTGGSSVNTASVRSMKKRVTDTPTSRTLPKEVVTKRMSLSTIPPPEAEEKVSSRPSKDKIEVAGHTNSNIVAGTSSDGASTSQLTTGERSPTLLGTYDQDYIYRTDSTQRHSTHLQPQHRRSASGSSSLNSRSKSMPLHTFKGNISNLHPAHSHRPMFVSRSPKGADELHPYVRHFTSPIDLDIPDEDDVLHTI